jgi:membrane protein implicated in regulation of membrane protease activity
MHTWTWFALAGVCAVLEVLNLSLVFASFSIGAAAAGLAAILGANTPVQWVTLALATVLSLRLKPILTRYIFRKTPALDTGIHALIGLNALATSNISGSTGTINLKNARCDSGEIATGQSVTVARIDGAVAIVLPRLESNINEGA